LHVIFVQSLQFFTALANASEADTAIGLVSEADTAIGLVSVADTAIGLVSVADTAIGLASVAGTNLASAVVGTDIDLASVALVAFTSLGAFVSLVVSTLLMLLAFVVQDQLVVMSVFDTAKLKDAAKTKLQLTNQDNILFILVSIFLSYKPKRTRPIRIKIVNTTILTGHTPSLTKAPCGQGT